MECPRCSFDNPDGFRFCGSCGAAIDDSAVDAAHSEQRRRVTVMFCDLVGSTQLSEELDPEEMRGLVHRYHEVAAPIIAYWGGLVARYVGDGLLVLFGVPNAHEDDAVRAVRAGLALTGAISELRAPGRPDHALAVRIGIDTGLVIVGPTGAGTERQEVDVIGETPNLAARLQQLAPPNAVLVTDATHQLVEGFVEAKPLGAKVISGLSRAVPVFAVTGATEAESRFDVAASRGLTPFIGRDRELGALRSGWERAVTGEGQVFVVTGEAGIGKTRLIHEFLATVNPATLTELRCSPDRQSTPLYPVARAWRAELDTEGAPSVDTVDQTLQAAGVDIDEGLGVAADLLSVDGGPAIDHLAAPVRYQRTLDVAEAWLTAAPRRPAVVVVENAHWADPSTLALAGRLLNRGPEPGVFLVMTARAGELPSFATPAVTAMHLDRLSPGEILRIVGALAPADERLPEDDVERVVERSDGVPLFAEELTASVLASRTQQHREAAPVPAGLYDSLISRLDRLGPTRYVAQVASVLGREFDAELLEAVCDVPAPGSHLQRLVAERVLVQDPDGATLRFKHALVRDAAYSSLLIAERRRLHIAAATEIVRQGVTDSENEVVARHYAEGAAYPEAIRFWQRAARRAAARGSVAETINALETAVELLARTPSSAERDERELRMLLRLGATLYLRSAGYGDRLAEISQRMRDLAARSGSPLDRIMALNVARGSHQIRAEFNEVLAIGDEVLSLATELGDPLSLLTAYDILGSGHLELGHVDTAAGFLARGMELYQPDMHGLFAQVSGHDPIVQLVGELAWTQWSQGRPDEALTTLTSLLERVGTSLHPFAHALLIDLIAVMHYNRHDPVPALGAARQARDAAEFLELEFLACHADVVTAWAECATGNVQRGLPIAERALGAMRGLGDRRLDRALTVYADALHRAGQEREALVALHEGQEQVLASNQRRESSELWRIEGEILAATGHLDASRVAFARGVEMAEQAGNIPLRLRVLVAWATCYPDDTSVRDELRQTLGRYADGFATPDAGAAARLLAGR